MKRKRKGLIVLAIVAMVAILGIGYAAITCNGCYFRYRLCRNY